MKHIPQRTCIACRTTTDKKGLLRIIRAPEGDVQLDVSGRANGRGAYLCLRIECLESALKKKLLERSLKAPLTEQLTNDLRARMEEEVK